MRPFYAHSANEDGAGLPERLATHLHRVAERAAEYAAVFSAEQQGRLAGLLHDLGKYADQFQRRLADPVHEAGRDHSFVGALLAATRYKQRGLVPALAIQGHHAGLRLLTDWRALAEDIARAVQSSPEQFTGSDVAALKQRFEDDGLQSPAGFEVALVPGGQFAAADMLDVRMLFSALVDADFIETEAHFAGDRAEPRRPREEGPELDPAPALAAVQRRIEELSRDPQASRPMQAIRTRLVVACLDAAQRPPGVFTLSAPTGSGKTLAMLAFALRHARIHDLRRVVLVMPFLTIVEQTAKVYRDLFGPANGFPDHYVVEDHSNVRRPTRDQDSKASDAVDENVRIARLLAENWDAPIILTTSVQCLESLMSNRHSACRKLHRLARSVILFDEVQTLPPHLAVPTLATLSHLSSRFGTTVVLATATQPAFDHLDQQVRSLASPGWRPTEIVPEAASLFPPAAERLRVRWRHQQPTAWDALADELASHEQALCILNLKQHARCLAEMLRDRGLNGLYHLSANMCAAHRMAVVDEVREGLCDVRPVHLIATQCVEAGVDLDFPVVYRALGPLEAIAQAAGRCNRHGTRHELGAVHVFTPVSEGRLLYPRGAYTHAAGATQTFLNHLVAGGIDLDHTEVLHDPGRLRTYYGQFYALTGAAQMKPEMITALDECNFVDVSQQYRLIDQGSINILVPYHREAFDRLRHEIEETCPLTPAFVRAWIRRARPHTVSLWRPRDEASIWNHLHPIDFSRGRRADYREAEFFLPLQGLAYDLLLGLVEGEDGAMIA